VAPDRGRLVMARVRREALIVVLFAGLTVLMTWPQAALVGTHVPSHDDPLLSIWRLSWIAHALVTDPLSLPDGNIFHPERRTLAYTDAVPLEGFIAAPFIASGVSPVLVYNLLVLASIGLSGVTTSVLVRRMTGSTEAGLVAGVVFAFVPYRFDHYHHLELHATVFMPLALWFLDRAFESGRWRDAAGFAASMVLQIFSSIYYAVFLATALAIVVPLRLRRVARDRRGTLLVQLVTVALVGGLVVAPYLWIYLQNRATVGERNLDQVLMYSATPVNYLSTLPENIAHGWWSSPLGRSERRLHPGFVALALAMCGLYGWHERKTTMVTLGVVGFILSLGVNTPVYDVLRDTVFTYRGLRVPARASILVFLAVSALAGYGWATMLARRPQWAKVGTTALIAILCLEYATLPPEWLALSSRPSATARWLARQPRQVVVEFPLPRADSLHTIYDGLYMYASTFHWQPILNGYSGFYPRSYLELTEVMREFPSEQALAYLKRREVDLIVLHGAYMSPGLLGFWASKLEAHPDVDAVAEFPESGGRDLVFRLRR
jgi:hypothetical protein